MATGYTRQSEADIVPGNTIEDSHFNNEFNQVQSAMHETTGHNHDGTTGGGAPIALSSTTGTLSVSQGGTGTTSLTDGGIVLGSGTSAVTVTSQPTDGQLLIGTTGGDPVLGTITAGEGIDVTNAAGSITIDAEIATDVNLGVAKFNTGSFIVTAGDVTLAASVPQSFTSDSGSAVPTSNTLSILGGEGIDTSASGTTVTIVGEDASTTNKGISELATATEINTGTDTTRTISPAELSDSNYGLHMFEFAIPSPVVGDGALYFETPAEIAGHNIVDIRAQWNGTVGTGAATSIQLHNTTQAADVLSTNLTIDAGERSSTTAATPPVIDTAQDDITLNDVYQIDIDAIGTTVAGTDLLIQVFTRIP